MHSFRLLLCVCPNTFIYYLFLIICVVESIRDASPPLTPSSLSHPPDPIFFPVKIIFIFCCYFFFLQKPIGCQGAMILAIHTV